MNKNTYNNNDSSEGDGQPPPCCRQQQLRRVQRRGGQRPAAVAAMRDDGSKTERSLCQLSSGMEFLALVTCGLLKSDFSSPRKRKG